jgi:N-acetylmuramoyl-L-alanine amidase
MFAAWVLTVFLIIPGISSAQNTDPVRPKQALRKIVIDAGHGGEDPGALGAFSSEKDISLSIALKLESKLREEMPDVEIYMTRTTDVFDPVTRKA